MLRGFGGGEFLKGIFSSCQPVCEKNVENM